MADLLTREEYAAIAAGDGPWEDSLDDSLIGSATPAISLCPYL